MFSPIVKSPDPWSVTYFFHKKTIVIPSYQRFYTWTSSIIEELIYDINYCINSKPKKELYLGTILIKEKGDSYKIIDGQQRVLTIIMLLRQLTNNGNLNSQNQNDSEKWFSSSEVERICVEKNEKRRNNYFNSVVLKGKESPLKEEHRHLVKNIDEALETIKIRFEDFTPNQINKIYGFIEKNMKMVVIKLSENAVESDIFEAINAKRVQLTDADLIKNFLISKTAGNIKKEEECLKLWGELYDSFKREKEFLGFLEYYCYATSKNKEDFGEGKENYGIYKFFKYKVFKRNDKDNIKVLNSLKDHQKYYTWIKEPDFNRKGNIIKKVNISLDCLDYLKFKSHIPFLMKTLNFTKKLDQNDFLKIVKLVEITQFLNHHFKEAGQQSIKDFFYDLMWELKSKKNLDKIINKLKKELNKLKEEYSKELKNYNSTARGGEINPRLSRYILYRIWANAHGSSLIKHRIVERDISTEHIIPNTMDKKKKKTPNPTTPWEKIILNDLKKDQELKEKTINLNKQDKIQYYYKNCIWSLGNLGLLTVADNAECGTNIFVYKKNKVYKPSNKEGKNDLFKYVRNQSTWNIDKIRKNGEFLAKEYLKLF